MAACSRWACAGGVVLKNMLSKTQLRVPANHFGVGRAGCTPKPTARRSEVCDNEKWKQSHYRLTHLGIKELDEVMAQYLKQMSTWLDSHLEYYRRCIQDVGELAEIDTIELWAFLFHEGELPERFRDNVALQGFLAYLQEKLTDLSPN